MGVQSKYGTSREEFAKIMNQPAGPGATEAARRQAAWTTLSFRITSEWDGMRGEAFFGALSPGQFATVVLQRMYGTVKRGDMESFLAGSPAMAMRCPRAFEIVGAAEYVALWEELESGFPGGKFPAHAEGWTSAIRKMKNLPLGGIQEKLVNGKGMARGLWEYVYDYAAAHPEEFCFD